MTGARAGVKGWGRGAASRAKAEDEPSKRASSHRRPTVRQLQLVDQARVHGLSTLFHPVLTKGPTGWNSRDLPCAAPPMQ
jgi:hypothetical protein